MNQFLAMGGYAQFVWPAYGIAVLVLGGMALQSYRAWRRQQTLWSAIEATRPQRRR
ncbi:MAG TPA: heme exporter protein CcmD [Stellaceae bacterium]|nr:heme exporter protein CcmD [Stellaceae bacterium]